MKPSAKSRPKVNIQEHRPLVDVRNSKKLAALVNKAAVLPDKSKPVVVLTLKSDSQLELQQARNLINARIDELMNRLPVGKRTKLFAVRFGSVEKIYALEIKVAFQRLGINVPLRWHLLAQRNCHGELV
jgi:hypothetical protein